MSNKRADLGNFDGTMGYYLNKYGPTSAAVGVTAAITSHIIAEQKRRAEEKEMFGQGKDDPGMIRIKLPPKTANADPALAGVLDSVSGFHEKLAGSLPPPQEDLLWKVPAIGAATAGVGYGTYTLADYLLRGLEKSRMKKTLGKAKDDYTNLVYKDVGIDNPAKTASTEFPVLEGLVESVVERLNEVSPYPKEASFREGASWFTSGAVAAGILSAINSFRKAKNSESDVDAYLQQKSRKAPLDTRIVVDSGDPMAPKVAAMTLPPPQPIAPVGFAQRLAEGLTQKKKEKFPVGQPQATPSTQVAPQPPVATSTPKLGGAMEVIMGAGLTGGHKALQGSPEGESPERRLMRAELAEADKAKKLSLENPVNSVDDSTVTINTPSGPVTVDALDHRSINFLKSRPDFVRNIVNSSAQ